jgi:hypothetical protein
MINVIIPIDFSETSFNAAHYGAKMYANRADVNIILYHFYTSGEDVEVAKNYLEGLQKELVDIAHTMETITESGNNFIESLM